jgi:hypothetical protein
MAAPNGERFPSAKEIKMQTQTFKLKFSKSTKGTHVYEMRTEAGVSIGSVYYPKLVIGETPPPELEQTLKVPG